MAGAHTRDMNTATATAAAEWAKTTSHWTQPGNKSDRERFAALTEWDQQATRKLVDRLYDGTRTVARCWKEALEAVEES